MDNNGTSPALGRIGVFDLETTGIDVSTARVVTAAVCLVGPDGQVERSLGWLADPGVEIPEQAEAVHGISTARARAEGRPAAEVVAEIIDALRALLTAGLPIVVYNAPYDFSLLHEEALRYGIEPLPSPSPIIDPLVIDKAVDRFRKGKRTLEAAAVHYGVVLSDAHDAAADAVAAGRVAQAIAARYPERFTGGMEELHRAQVDWFREQAESFEEYMRRSKNPAFRAARGWPLRSAADVS